MDKSVDWMQWALPGGLEVPRDELKVQIEVYSESILLRGFENNTSWVKMVSADAIAATLSQQVGFSSGLLPEGAVWWGQGATGKVVALWRPPQVRRVALQSRAFEAPRRFALPMPGLLFVCSPGRAPWVYAAPSRPTAPADQLYMMPAVQCLCRWTRVSGQPQLPGGRRRDTGVLLPVLLLAHGEYSREVQETSGRPRDTVGGTGRTDGIPSRRPRIPMHCSRSHAGGAGGCESWLRIHLTRLDT